MLKIMSEKSLPDVARGSGPVASLLGCMLLAIAASGAGCGDGDGTGGNAGAGGSGMIDAVNDCDSNAAIDMTSGSIVTITFAGIEYTPRCVRIHAGASVSFSGNFEAHPLLGGVVKDGVGAADQGSPIPATNSGMEKEFAMPNAGTYPYYCTAHVSSGMMGAIFVEKK